MKTHVKGNLVTDIKIKFIKYQSVIIIASLLMVNLL